MVRKFQGSSSLARLRDFSSGYRTLCLRGLRNLCSWLLAQSYRVDLNAPVWEIDDYLTRYVMEQRALRAPFNVTKHAILGLQIRFPRLKTHLVATWRALNRWEKVQGTRPRTPMCLELVNFLFLLCLELSSRASAGEASLWLALGVIVRMGFHGLMRPGEILARSWTDISFVTPPLRSVLAIIAIGTPKTRRLRAAGRTQFTTVRDHPTVLWLQALKCHQRGKGKPWPSTRTMFRAMFARGLACAGLQQMRLTPASLRAGGATFELLQGHSVEAIAFHGRWAAIDSLKSYLQEGASHLIWAAVPSSARAKIEQFLIRYAPILNAPPPSLVR